MSFRTQDDRLKRISECELGFPNRWGIPTRIFAIEEIPLERVAVDELSELPAVVPQSSMNSSMVPLHFYPRSFRFASVPDFRKHFEQK